jgi:hypothetical protein
LVVLVVSVSRTFPRERVGRFFWWGECALGGGGVRLVVVVVGRGFSAGGECAERV